MGALAFAVAIATAAATWAAVDQFATLTSGHFISVVLGAFALPLSVAGIVEHLLAYNAPRRQRFAVRIMLMVAIYVIDSTWAFFDVGDASAIALARDTYEAYVIYNFFWLIIDLMGGVDATVHYWAKHSPTMDHMFPLRGKMTLDLNALKLWRVFMIQYVVISPLVTLITYVTELTGDYSDSSWSFENAHLYLAIIRCVSVSVAFTALMYLYFSTRHHLHDEFNPTAMFISIKAVIFLGCWQGLVLWGLNSVGWFPLESVRRWIFGDVAGTEAADDEVVLAALENFMVCVEMTAAAIAHQFVFAPRIFGITQAAKPGSPVLSTRSFGARFQHAFNVLDVTREALDSVRDLKEKKTK